MSQRHPILFWREINRRLPELINHPGLSAAVENTGLYTLMDSTLLLLSPTIWIARQGGIRPAIETLEVWLQNWGEPPVGVLALLFAAYLFCEGIHRLEVMTTLALKS